MPGPEEEVVSVLVSADEYAYHINQVASVGADSLRVLRKRLSIKTPYTIESISISSCTRVDYAARLSPFRIAVGVLLIALILGIFYYIGVYWSQLESGTSIRVGLLVLALLYGLKWAFMSRHHRVVFHLRDGTRLGWRSRPGDFKYKERAVSNLMAHLKTRGLAANGN
jgi:hypothetical protein